MEKKEYEKACFIALASYGGRRKSELCRFKVSDFADDKLICEGALYRSDPIKTKGRGQLGKPLNCYTLAKEFDPYLHAWMEDRRKKHIESEWLFPDPLNGEHHIDVHEVEKWVSEFSLLSDKAFYYHSLRHFYTTMLSQHGIPDNVIKEILGWESLDLVSVYCDTRSEDMISQYFGKGGFKAEKDRPQGFSEI